ncbi:MAG: NAD-dependent epimerase/dehydratase family protein [Gammaproteobacteria bacterium]|nr:NAD-dependent epimerase/dehydratase family protein [Gammaproteobacteria bacterium]
MENSEKTITVIIGKRSNLSSTLSKRLRVTDLLSSESLLESLFQLDKYNGKKINVVFNNFQPSTQLKSFINPALYVEISISLTVKILTYLIDSNAKINKIIYTSSSSVYGNSSVACEDSQPCPVTIPSSLKHLNEQFLERICHQHKLNLTITRVFNMYGGNDKFSIIRKLYDCYQNKIVLTIFNNGNSIRDFIHVDNVVDVYEKLLLDSSININILNIGSGKGYSLSNILKNLSKKGYCIDTSNTYSKEVSLSKSNTIRLNTVVDVASFIDVNEYLLNKLSKTCQG